MTSKLERLFLIAEAGVNHNGSPEMAMQLVDVAADCGADAIKFQTFRSEAVIGRNAQKAEYQKSTTGETESQLEMVKKLELTKEAHLALRGRCRDRGIQFLSTPFDTDSADFLVTEIGIDIVKVPSGEITNAPFLLYIARLGRPVILSTGMSTLGEVEMALGVLAYGYLGCIDSPSEKVFRDCFSSDSGQAILARNVSLLHCTTEYPAPVDQVNLRAMDTLGAAFQLPVGFSDHTQGIAVAIAAAARGAKIIEKHFTLDRTLKGPDHKASLEPEELAAMIAGIRQVEAALGSSVKRPTASEWGNRDVARRSLVAARDVMPGETWSSDNLACKRPGTGLSPLLYWEFQETLAGRAYASDEQLAG